MISDSHAALLRWMVGQTFVILQLPRLSPPTTHLSRAIVAGLSKLSSGISVSGARSSDLRATQQ